MQEKENAGERKGAKQEEDWNSYAVSSIVFWVEERVESFMWYSELDWIILCCQKTPTK